jgi:hypothetical protein
VDPQIIKNRITIGSSYYTSYSYSKELRAKYQRNICTPMFIAAFFIIEKIGNNQVPLRDQYYSILKGEKILTQATT